MYVNSWNQNQKYAMERYRNSVAVVTGASAGIGAAVVGKLIENGLKVVGLARRLEKLNELSETFSSLPGQFYAVKCDISKEEQIIEAFSWIKKNIGAIEILVNNAGVLREGFLYNGRSEDWSTMFSINVLGLMICTREAVAHGVRHIVHVNSIAGHSVPRHEPPAGGAYPASKHAVTALAQCWLPRVKVTSVSPGLTYTDMYTAEDEAKGLPCLQPKDVANAVLFALGQPSHVQVDEIIIKPTSEYV